MITRRNQIALILLLFVIVNILPVIATIETLNVGLIVNQGKVGQIDSNDVTISIVKNSTGLGQFSSIEFQVTLKNTLSSSVYNVNIHAEHTFPNIDITPIAIPTIPEIEPDNSEIVSLIAKLKSNNTISAVDLLLIMDASGSMGNEIESVKQKITDLINNISQEIPDLRIGIIIYGWEEYSNYPMDHPGNQLQFTTDFDAVKTFINSLYANGGTEPWGDALHLGNTWNWRETAQKLIIMVGDEDCDPGKVVGTDYSTAGYYNGSQLVNVISSLKEKGVIINTVISDIADGNIEDQFKWVARYTGGKSVYLPDMEAEGIDLPTLIEEWTIELGREYHKQMKIIVTWEDGVPTTYTNNKIVEFWLDLTFPSIIISPKIIPTGEGIYSVELLAEVTDFSPISFVTLYHDATGPWSSIFMTPISNISYWVAQIDNLPEGKNLSYSITSSDILKNVGSTPTQWLIVEPPRHKIGEEITIWAQKNDIIFSRFDSEASGVYHLILSGSDQIKSLFVDIRSDDDSSSVGPDLNVVQNVSSSKWRRVYSFSLDIRLYELNISVPATVGNFSFSYVWVTLDNMTEEVFTGEMTEKIRVYGLQWDLTNGTYLNIQMDTGSPLVIYGEVYDDEWQYIGRFTVAESLLVIENRTYYVVIWATLRTGEFQIVLSEIPVVDTDPYYYPSATAFGGPTSFPEWIFLFFGLWCLYTTSRNKKKRG
ncbi:MAG: VWA domain-containing protein [Candidatus Heimdallarchaeota archaeon]